MLCIYTISAKNNNFAKLIKFYLYLNKIAIQSQYCLEIVLTIKYIINVYIIYKSACVVCYLPPLCWFNTVYSIIVN